MREAGDAGARPAPLRRAAHGRRRPPLRLGRRDEDRRGQDARVDPAGLPQRPVAARACTSSRSTTTWPPATREWMGRLHRWLGLTVGLIVPGQQRPRLQARRSTPPTSPTAPTTSSASTTSATTWRRRRARQVQRGHVYAIVDEVDSILIDEARTPLIISGRVADAAQLYYKFASIVRGLKRDDRLRGRRGEAHRRPHRGGHREGRARSSASRTSTTAWPRTWCTSSRPPSGPRSCSSATRTTWSSAAR